MGNTVSADNGKTDTWWPPPKEDTISVDILPETIQTKTTLETTENNEPNKIINTEDEYENTRRTHREQKIKEFKTEWEKKNIARREAIAERSREIIFLREELVKYKTENEQLKNLLKHNDANEAQAENLEEIKFELQTLKHENDNLQKKIAQLNEEIIKSDEITKQNLDLRKSIAETQKDLQSVNAQILDFEKEKHDYETHVIALKDVIKVSKSLLQIRENQLHELKTKVAEIETSLAEREVSMMSTDLKDEYERQLENIRSLRALYEQRQAATKAERDLMASQLTDAKNNLENEQKKIGEMQERINELEENVSDKYDQIKNLESLLGLTKAEYRGLEAEMSVINQLFSQILFGFNNCQEINFDKLTKLLEENHDVLTNIAINEESEAISSALPKTLLDLVNQVAEETKNDEANFIITENNLDETNLNNGLQLATIPEETVHTDQQISNQMNSAEEIVNKLPKVWRVLIELLRQQCGQQPVEIDEDGTDPCYKSIDTPKGPKLVLSVSKTFIRLKDLILEKKSVEKEMFRLKQLNTHLETRLQDQEKRLETVSSELNKTWHVVGRMQRQHQQLHTHEKILRYELSQKRKMLTELKQELEYCRANWEKAREKNSNTEEEWKKLRIEFASRKTVVADELNNSAESGYSDEPDGSSDEEIEKRKKKALNKITSGSESDDESKSSSSTIKSDISTELSSISNQGKNQIDKAFAECSHSIVKPEGEVQTVIRKTQPASLDMIDDVCALAISPVVIINDVFSIQFNEIVEQNKDSIAVEVSENLTNLVGEETIENCNKTELEITNTVKNSSIEELPNLAINSSSDSNLETVDKNEEIPTTSNETPSTSTSTSRENLTQDERLQRREERLQRLEEQCRQLVKKVVNTNSRSTAIGNRLDALHEQYGNDNPRTTVQESEPNIENNSNESNTENTN